MGGESPWARVPARSRETAKPGEGFTHIVGVPSLLPVKGSTRKNRHRESRLMKEEARKAKGKKKACGGGEISHKERGKAQLPEPR